VRLAERDPALVRVIPDLLTIPLDTWLAMHENLRSNPPARRSTSAGRRVGRLRQRELIKRRDLCAVLQQQIRRAVCKVLVSMLTVLRINGRGKSAQRLRGAGDATEQTRRCFARSSPPPASSPLDIQRP
jgi:hypothetical protein